MGNIEEEAGACMHGVVHQVRARRCHPPPPHG